MLHVRRGHSSSVPRARPKGRPWELPPQPSSSLAPSRWSEPAEAVSSSRSSSLRSPVSPLKGAAGRARSSSLSPGEALPPQTPPNRRTAEAVLLHWWFSPALRSVPHRHRHSPDARLPGAREGGTGGFLFLFVLLLPALVGSVQCGDVRRSAR